ncbi:SDR family oxidoreductase [Pontibacillus litoralis]|uniref:3-oxoacyl-ACP reductase n=1 Tax=Pontibacillus litoralis JSM 072002 TaxID=1385512 RepID=A0A0A5G9J7_9BACI|nr:SDR family oxidoreductase [Pontibacillus litoralis]KGX87790.1 3-oxoacyl-ACP reductase [Pontibacillus litoralis JSM 072002]
MDLHLTGKKVLVLAASKGLGKSIAKQFLREGAHVLICSRKQEHLLQAVQEIQSDGDSEGRLFTQVCDLTDEQSITKLFEVAKEQLGGVDILINNAGGPPAGSFMQLDDEAWQGAFELNLLSYIRASRLAIPFMQQAGGGRILNIASSSIKQPIDGLVLSNTFRNGIVGLSKTLANEFAEDGILVNTLAPGRIGTERVAELDSIRAEKRSISIDDVTTEMVAKIPLGRYGTPEEFAKTAVFLASFANTYITGQSLLVDGGYVRSI